jgi:hypothetical protein
MTKDLESSYLQVNPSLCNAADGVCNRTVATLRIYGDELDPELISNRLRISPSKSQRKGQVLASRLGRIRTANIGGWFLSSESNVDSKDLRDHLDWLVAQLRDVVPELTQLQIQPGIRMRVTVIWWSKGSDGWFTLTPQHMRALAEMNLECQFELAFYGPEDDPSLFQPNATAKDAAP